MLWLVTLHSRPRHRLRYVCERKCCLFFMLLCIWAPLHSPPTDTHVLSRHVGTSCVLGCSQLCESVPRHEPRTPCL